MLRPHPKPSLKTQAAEEVSDALAIEVLGFLAADAERLGRFLDAAGLDPGDIRAAAGRPDFLTGVLDYICADEPLLIAFAQETQRDPAALEAARLRRSGPKSWPD